MTEAEFSFEENYIDLVLDIDLSRIYSDRLSYFEASRQDPCALLGETEPNVDQILSEISLIFEGSQQGDSYESGTSRRENVRWTEISCAFSPEEKSVYLDYLQWPKVRIKARGKTSGSLNLSSDARVYGVFNTGFPYEEPIAITFRADKDRKMTRWLIAGQRSPDFPLSEGTVQKRDDGLTPLFYLIQGFVHILPRGLDHILFVMALVFTTTGLINRLKLLTIFTVAHSISMAAMVWNAFSINMGIAEIFIALSIVWVGLECLGLIRTDKLRVVLIFFFGLVHGLGFANILSELTLPYGSALLALLSFNLGVELGQVTVVSALMCFLWLISFIPKGYASVQKFFSVIAILAGAFWTFQRLLNI